MKTGLIFCAVLAVGLACLSGCASSPKRELSKIQGNWVGQEVGGPPGECRVTVTGDLLRFQGARQGEWYLAKFIPNPKARPNEADVLIQDCPAPQYIGKIAKGIYRLEGKKLTIAANEPGDESRATSFERTGNSRSRIFVFTKQ